MLKEALRLFAEAKGEQQAKMGGAVSISPASRRKLEAELQQLRTMLAAPADPRYNANPKRGVEALRSRAAKIEQSLATGTGSL